MRAIIGGRWPCSSACGCWARAPRGRFGSRSSRPSSCSRRRTGSTSARPRGGARGSARARRRVCPPTWAAKRAPPPHVTSIPGALAREAKHARCSRPQQEACSGTQHAAADLLRLAAARGLPRRGMPRCGLPAACLQPACGLLAACLRLASVLLRGGHPDSTHSQKANNSDFPLKMPVFTVFVESRLWLPRAAQERPKEPQEDPRAAQKGPKAGPREGQEPSRAGQEGAQGAPGQARGEPKMIPPEASGGQK